VGGSLKVLGVHASAKISLVTLLGFAGCARTDFQAFDEFAESAGEGGTSNGGASTGGFAGTSVTGGFAGTSVTGGVGGTGGGVCRDGRERCGNECVLTDRDPNHCGGCFYTCPGDTECVGGVCEPFCDGSTYCNGICTDITRDPRNCGGCGYVCPPNQSCRSGYCTTLCEDDFIRCGGVCVDWTSDPNNCGWCGNSCERGMSPNACVDGVCRCPGRQVDCGAGCTDVQTDPSNCGACGFSCAAGQFCANGSCQFECPPGFSSCNGQCKDLLTDPSSCGMCGKTCGMREYCTSGLCRPLPGTVTYSVGPSPLPFVNACGQPGSFQLLDDVDDDLSALMMPFQFRFYGYSAAVAWASSNGIVGFGQSTPDFQNACEGLGVSLAVMAFWDDLATRRPGVCVATLGSSPNRQFVVTWSEAFILGIPATHLTFSVVLNEGSDVIDVLYGTMTGGGGLSSGQDATIGLASEREYALDCCNEACVASNTGRRYTPVLP
jgi:hypothetical protein